MMIEAGHADSLAGPMSEMKKSFEAKKPDVMVNIPPGAPKNWPAVSSKGDVCAAVMVANDVYIISFPAKVNLSEDIRNVVTIPGAAKNVPTANSFVRFMLSEEGRQILKKTGQPPIVPPIKEGTVPFNLLNLPAED